MIFWRYKLLRSYSQAPNISHACDNEFGGALILGFFFYFLVLFCEFVCAWDRKQDNKSIIMAK